MGQGTNQENGRSWQKRKSPLQGYCWPWHFTSEMEQRQVWHLVEGARLLLQLGSLPPQVPPYLLRRRPLA